eukprot:Pgem_evm1s2692
MLYFKYNPKVDDLEQMSDDEIIKTLEYAATHGHVKTVENILSFCKPFQLDLGSAIGLAAVHNRFEVINCFNSSNWSVTSFGLRAAAEYGNLSMIKYLMTEVNDKFDEKDDYEKDELYNLFFEICEQAFNNRHFDVI